MTKVSMAPMKEKALDFVEPVKSLILSEPDFMDVEEFISKLGTWEKLLKITVKDNAEITQKPSILNKRGLGNDITPEKVKK